MTIRVLLLSMFVVSMLSGCASVGGSEEYQRVTSISMSSLVSDIENSPSIKIDELLSGSETLDSNRISVEINSTSSAVVAIDGKNI